MQISRTLRIASGLIDFIIMSFIGFVICLPMLAVSMVIMVKPTHGHQGMLFFSNAIYFFLVAFDIFFFKDSFNGRSVGKRVCKLQVINVKTGLAASAIQCIIRNVFMLIWPVEFIMLLANPSRRLGDIIAGTEVVAYDNNKEAAKTNFMRLLLYFIIALALTSIIVLPIRNFLSEVDKDSIEYVESSYNEVESKQLMQVFTDSLGADLSTDIRVYDKTKMSNKKYISALVHFKKDFFATKDNYNDIDLRFRTILYDQFPQQALTGEIKYYMQGNHSSEMRVESLDKKTKSYITYYIESNN